MLHHSLPPTQRTLWLLPYPVPDARPAKHVPALRRRRVPQLLQAQRALALLPALDPRHHVAPGRAQIIARPPPARHRRVRRRANLGQAPLVPVPATSTGG